MSLYTVTIVCRRGPRQLLKCDKITLTIDDQTVIDMICTPPDATTLTTCLGARASDLRFAVDEQGHIRVSKEIVTGTLPLFP